MTREESRLEFCRLGSKVKDWNAKDEWHQAMYARCRDLYVYWFCNGKEPVSLKEWHEPPHPECSERNVDPTASRENYSGVDGSQVSANMTDEEKEELAKKKVREIWKDWDEKCRLQQEAARRRRMAELLPLIKDGCLFIPEGTERIRSWEYANEDMFTSVHIPGSVTIIEEGAFKKTPYLAEVVMEEGVRCIGEKAFENCPSLKKVTLPNGLKEIEYGAFYECVSLESVNMPKSLEKIGNDAFRKCPKLPRQTLPVGISSIEGQSFDLVPNIPAENKKYKTVSGLLIDKEFNNLLGADVSLTEVVVPEGMVYVSDNAFTGCRSLRSVTFPDSIFEMFEAVFSQCTSLVSVTLPKKVLYIGQFFFSHCSSLQSIDIPLGFYGIYEWGFAQCTALHTIKLPETLKFICNSAFLECSALESIDIPDSVRSIGYSVFENCTSLKRVFMSQKLYSKVLKKKLDIFKGCTALESIILRSKGNECQVVQFQHDCKER